MSFLALVGASVVVAFSIGYIIRFLTRPTQRRTNEDVQSANANKSAGVDATVHQSPDHDVNQPTQPPCVGEKTIQHHLHPARDICQVKSGAQAKSDIEVKLDNSVDLHQQLCRERKQRERAEDWAEFILRELEAHIQALNAAEIQCRKLARRQIDPSNPVTGNKTRKFSKYIKDVKEAWLTNRTDPAESISHKANRKSEELQENDNEWNQIVQYNENYLQSMHQNRRLSSDSTKYNSTALYPSSSEKNAKNMIDKIDLKTPISLQKDESLKQNETMPTIIICPANTSEDDQMDLENPHVFTESVSNIKKTQQLWENFSSTSSISRDSNEGPSPSPSNPAVTDKKFFSEDNDELPRGLVSKNMKLFESSENVGGI